MKALKPQEFAPEAVRSLLVASFTDPEHPAFGQAATVDADGRAQIRTVHFRYWEKAGTVGFASHIRAPKWGQVKRHLRFGGCFFDTFRGIQIRWEGAAMIVSPEAAVGLEATLLDEAWNVIRPDVRSAYWLDERGKKMSDPLPSGVDIGRRAPSLGVVLGLPQTWDLFTLGKHDYREGKRVLYERSGEGWRTIPVSLLHAG